MIRIWTDCSRVEGPRSSLAKHISLGNISYQVNWSNGDLIPIRVLKRRAIGVTCAFGGGFGGTTGSELSIILDAHNPESLQIVLSDGSVCCYQLTRLEQDQNEVPAGTAVLSRKRNNVESQE